MKMSFTYKGLCLAALMSCVFSTQTSAQIINGGFESGFTGWTLANQLGSDGTFMIQSGTTSPVNGFDVPKPTQKKHAAMTDSQAGGSHVLYQDFVVPNTVLGASLSFDLFVNSGDTFVNGPNLNWDSTSRTGGQNLNQQARVDIMLASADPFSVDGSSILMNLYQTLPVDPLTSGYTTRTADLLSLFQAHRGETLRLRFAEVDNITFFNLGVDNVRLSVTSVPEPSVVMYLSGGALFGLTLLRRRRLS